MPARSCALTCIVSVTSIREVMPKSTTGMVLPAAELATTTLTGTPRIRRLSESIRNGVRVSVPVVAPTRLTEVSTPTESLSGELKITESVTGVAKTPLAMKPRAFTMLGLLPLSDTAIVNPTTAVSLAFGFVMIATDGDWLPVPMNAVSGFETLCAPSIADAMTVTVVPGGTVDGTGTLYGSVTEVTALENVVSNVPLIPGPDTLTRTSRRPRLSVATTLNATTESEDGAAALTVTTGGVVSAMTPPPGPLPSTHAPATTSAARPTRRPARPGVTARA